MRERTIFLGNILLLLYEGLKIDPVFKTYGEFIYKDYKDKLEKIDEKIYPYTK